MARSAARSKTKAADPPPPSDDRKTKYFRLIETARGQVQDGKVPQLRPSEIQELERSFTQEELYALVIPKRTLMRRKASNSPLTAEETDKALRLARVTSEADRVFGDPEKSSLWLRRKNRALSGHAPLDLLQTETGARMVEELLGQIDYGMVV